MLPLPFDKIVDEDPMTWACPADELSDLPSVDMCQAGRRNIPNRVIGLTTRATL